MFQDYEINKIMRENDRREREIRRKQQQIIREQRRNKSRK